MPKYGGIPYGRYRYFEVSYYSYSDELIWLDQTVGQIRRYCQTLSQEVKLEEGEQSNTSKCNPISGKLEKIIEDKKHPARKWLIKQNAYFGTRKRKSVTVDDYFQSANAPLMLSPQIIEDIFQLGFMPNEIVKAYRLAYTSDQLPI